jgi:hypothetical protein
MRQPRVNAALADDGQIAWVAPGHFADGVLSAMHPERWTLAPSGDVEVAA